MLYYKLIKLTSCENIICITEEEYGDWINQKSIKLSNPVVLTGIKIPFPDREMFMEKFILNTWIPFGSCEEIEIPINQIITMTDVNDQLISRYNEYIIYREDDDSEPSLEDMSDDLFFGDDNNDGENDDGNDDEETEEDQDDEYEGEGPPSRSTGRNKRTLH